MGQQLRKERSVRLRFSLPAHYSVLISPSVVTYQAYGDLSKLEADIDCIDPVIQDLV